MKNNETIGDRLSKILKKYGEDICGEITFEEAKKNASLKWKNVLRNPIDTKIVNFMTFRKKSLNVENWILFLFQEMIEDEYFNFVKEQDFWIKDFVKAAICCEYNDIYFEMFN